MTEVLTAAAPLDPQARAAGGAAQLRARMARRPADDGTIAVVTDHGPIPLPSDRITSLRPVDGC